ncbi:MAG: hypothetical protein ACD_4C00057G0004 [uncultured bacterium (gcode 4)]|uniref:Uncharacterized protein n=1 Tax=uncultured bacterium (gcode 4) TaxID=1234023 RepID=K2FYU9_9BACT|nr:MAG: hypothetical protein ACD_4C00057G0004 [uncultured bacterium (gcode 4)]
MKTKFGEKYFWLDDMKQRISLIRNEYQVLKTVNIVWKQIDHVLWRQFIGQLHKDQDWYRVTVMGDNDMHGYLSLHESLHILLEETWLTFNIEQEDQDLKNFLFTLRNFINDFLIETEIKMKCGEIYGDDVLCTKDSQIIGQFKWLWNSSGLRVFMEWILNVAISKLYPSVKKNKATCLFEGPISFPNQDKIVDLLNNVNLFEIEKNKYDLLVSDICLLLTWSGLCFLDNHTEIIHKQKVVNFMSNTDEVFQNIKNILSRYL